MTGNDTSETLKRFLARWQFRAALLVVAVVLAYLPAAINAGYIWDDDVYVQNNQLLYTPDGLQRIWFSFDSPSQYFPLVYTVLRAEYSIWKLKPHGYHIVNILLHAVNALLVWRLLSRLKIPGAWLAAMIFALHPVQVESVAWITEHKNTLSTYFFLLTLLLWVEFVDEDSQKRWKIYVFALVCCAMALFAKTTACTIPASLFLVLWLQRKPITRRRIAEIVPFGVLGFAMGMLTVWWESAHQGTHGKLFALGLADRALIASHAVWFYLGKILWPVNLAFSYPHWTLQPWNPLSYGWLLAAIVAAYAIYCAREDLGRGVEVAAVFFVATLSPMLGFIMLYTFLYSFVADHYQYLACLGPIALISAGIVKLAQASPQYRRAIYAGATGIVLVLALLTYKQCGIYHDSKTIWADTLRKNPDSLLANYDLGNDFMIAANDIADPTIRNIALKDSLERYNHALAIDPKFVDAWANRAQLLASLGRPGEARADYEHAVSLEPGNARAQNEYGIFLRRQGDPANAAVHFRKASDAEPHWLPYRKNLIDALMAVHDFAAVLSEYQDIEGYFPNLPLSHIELGPAWLNLGKPAEAIREYREALRLAPDSVEAQTRLAWLLATLPDPALRNPSEALELAEKACALTKRENAVSLNTLAAAYAANKRFDDAVNTCATALAIAQRAGDKPLAATIQEHLRLYQSGHTLYDPKPQ